MGLFKIGDYVMCNSHIGLVVRREKGKIHILWTNGNINSWHSWQVKQNMHGRYWRVATQAEVLLYWNYPAPTVTDTNYKGVIFNGREYY